MARGTRTATSEVLKHLMHPARLRCNAAVGAYFSTQNSSSTDEDAGERIRTVVESAVDTLPRIQRKIVQRCDMDGEMHRTVASDLAISLRHFYRLRARAIATITRALTNGLPPARTSAPVLDALDIVLSHAETYEQAGAPLQAVSRLVRLSAGLGPAPARVTVECRIAHVYANCGHVELAREHLRAANAVATTLPLDARRSAMLEVEVAQGFVDGASGDTRSVRASFVHVVPELRNLVGERATPKLDETLAVALTLQAERCRDAGLLRDAMAAANEATKILDRAEAARPLLRLRSRHQALAALCLIPSRQQAATRDLAALSIEAARSGFVRESALIAGELASLYRVLGSPRKALEVALPTLSALRETCGRTNVAVILSDVAASHAALHQYEAAAELLVEVDALAPTLYARALGCLRRAEVAYAQRQLDKAADAAAAGRDGFLRLGNQRLAATCMRVLAEVLEAQGRTNSAATTIADSLDLQGTSAFPYARARTLRTAARIMHDRRYLAAAREIARS